MVTFMIDDDGRVWHITHCSMLFNWVIKDASSNFCFLTTGVTASSQTLLKLFICWLSPISICLNTPSLLCYIKWYTSVKTVTFIDNKLLTFHISAKTRINMPQLVYQVNIWHYSVMLCQHSDLNQQAIYATFKHQ